MKKIIISILIFISGAVSSQNYTITANKSSFAFGENANFTLSVSPTTLPANISVIWYSQNQSSVIGTGTNLQLNINNLKKDTIFYCRFEGCESNWTGFIPINININKIENYNVESSPTSIFITFLIKILIDYQ